MKDLGEQAKGGAGDGFAKGQASARMLVLGGCLLGSLISGGGFLVSAVQDRALVSFQDVLAQDRRHLLETLQDLQVERPRRRLQELADLPLLSEYVEIAAEDPQSIDAQELKAYMQSVFEAAMDENGFSDITLVLADGRNLLSLANPGLAQSPGTDRDVQVPVHSFEAVAGDVPLAQLVGSLKMGGGIRLTEVPGDVSSTGAIGESLGEGRFAERAGLAAAPYRSTWIFGLFAGAATFLAAFVAAALLRKSAR